MKFTALTMVLIAICMCCLAPASLAGHDDDDIRITFVVPDQQGPKFWSIVTDMSAKVAQDLGITLDVVYGGSNRFGMMEAIEQILQRQHKPDYLIFRPFYGNAVKIFDLLEQHRQRFVTLEKAYIEEEWAEAGASKTEYSYWLGQVDYDNQKGGELLLNTLINIATEQLPDEPILLTAIGGDFDGVSRDREKALLEWNVSHPSAHISQIFPSHWDPATVRQRFDHIMARYPHSNVFWCAGDELGLTVLELLDDNPDGNYVIGGFDWLPRSLEKIRQGRYAATVGGHFMMGAQAVIRLYDYHHGIDRLRHQRDSYQFEVIHSGNVEPYYSFLADELWRELNYTRFSEHKSAPQQPLMMDVQNLMNHFVDTSGQQAHMD